MLQRFVGAVPQMFVEEPVLAVGGVAAVEQFALLPDRARTRQLTIDGGHQGGAVELQAVAHAVEELERPANVEADFKPGIDQRLREAVYSALGAGLGEDMGNPAADREVPLGVKQGIDQLADGAMRMAQEEATRPLEGLTPGEQPDRERHDGRIE